VVQILVIYETEGWDVSRKRRKKMLATVMDCLRRSCRRRRLDRIRNGRIRGIM
jgi:hypothetical protein